MSHAMLLRLIADGLASLLLFAAYIAAVVILLAEPRRDRRRAEPDAASESMWAEFDEYEKGTGR